MPHEHAINASLDVMRSHIAALNAGDEQALAATLHFPHFRLSDAELKVWDTPDSYFEDFRARAGADWKRSDFRDIRVVSASAEKVHLDVEVVRFDATGNEIACFRSLWVITCEGDEWAAKFRSSFASK